VEDKVDNKGEEGTQPSSPVRIVIADDHPLFRAALMQLLSEHFELIEVVGEASDGREALELCLKLRPKVVLMDVQMPNMNGIEAARQIKQEAPSTMVLMMTAFESPDYLLEAIEAGASGYVLKHESAAQIADAIRRGLSGEAPLNSAVVMQLLGRLIEEKNKGPSTQRSLPEEGTHLQQPVAAALSLSAQEKEILKLMAQGKSNREIAKSLFVSVSSVKRYVRHIMTTLRASDRVHAILQANELGLLEDDSEPSGSNG
jgi:DNA-binding NarL/FixJ family response regulator